MTVVFSYPINHKKKNPPQSQKYNKINISLRYTFNLCLLIAQFFEDAWKIILIIVNIIMLLLANKIYLFHTLEEFKDIRKGEILDLLKYGIPFGVIFIVIKYIIQALDYAAHAIMDEWVEKNYLR